MPTFNVIKQSNNYYHVEGDLTFFSLDKNNIKSFGFLNSSKKLCMDLAKVSAADSAGLALMIEWIKQSKLCGTKLSFKNIPQQLLTLAKLSNIDITDLNHS